MKMVSLECIDTVVMDEGYISFTKGKEYTAYRKLVNGLIDDPYGSGYELIAINDKKERHTIRKFYSMSLEEFYRKHFREK